ncbi:hypothetical protein [Roseospirillum parvum]|uniref:Uncharacterized protein n=1 Tax=Roseospirillum parvum TaxID=83401 RepID=A0A1G8CXX4_9PROT|nr:hypothetical protein [Roseospirillum parvum]SDH50282.1 hypothetical protein SAMN05421742_107128 [Roseospirillum parvum]
MFEILVAGAGIFITLAHIYLTHLKQKEGLYERRLKLVETVTKAGKADAAAVAEAKRLFRPAVAKAFVAASEAQGDEAKAKVEELTEKVSPDLDMAEPFWQWVVRGAVNWYQCGRAFAVSKMGGAKA